MKLAAISGVNGVLTDADIARVRKLARAARAAQTPPLGRPTRTKVESPPHKRAAVPQRRRASA
jgi:hypothetical protein